MVRSPCIGVCRIDPEFGLCRGCLRTLDEITTWNQAADDVRLGILAALEPRREKHASWQDDLRCDCED